MGLGTDMMWVMKEFDIGTLVWLLSKKVEGMFHWGNGEGNTTSLEEPGILVGLKDCSGVGEDLGRRCRIEEKKKLGSRRGMVPIPLSNVRILHPKPVVAKEQQLKLLMVKGKNRQQKVIQ